MVEVFKTNISNPYQANQMLEILSACFPSYLINFDLHDCDNILRIEASDVNPQAVIQILRENDNICERLN